MIKKKLKRLFGNMRIKNLRNAAVDFFVKSGMPKVILF